jgi:hypothetical protein
MNFPLGAGLEFEKIKPIAFYSPLGAGPKKGEPG